MATNADVASEEQQSLMKGEEIPSKAQPQEKDGTR